MSGHMGVVLERQSREVVVKALLLYIRAREEGMDVDRAQSILSELEDENKNIYLIDYPEMTFNIDEYVGAID